MAFAHEFTAWAALQRHTRLAELNRAPNTGNAERFKTINKEKTP